MTKSRLLTRHQLDHYLPCGSGRTRFIEACAADTASPPSSLLIVDDPAWVWKFAPFFQRAHIWWVAYRFLEPSDRWIFEKVTGASWVGKVEREWGKQSLRSPDRARELRGFESVVLLSVFAHLYVQGG